MHCWSVRHGRWTPLIHLPTTTGCLDVDAPPLALSSCPACADISAICFRSTFWNYSCLAYFCKASAQTRVVAATSIFFSCSTIIASHYFFHFCW